MSCLKPELSPCPLHTRLQSKSDKSAHIPFAINNLLQLAHVLLSCGLAHWQPPCLQLVGSRLRFGSAMLGKLNSLPCLGWSEAPAASGKPIPVPAASWQHQASVQGKCVHLEIPVLFSIVSVVLLPDSLPSPRVSGGTLYSYRARLNFFYQQQEGWHCYLSTVSIYSTVQSMRTL